MDCINIDLRKTPAVDVIADVRHLPFKDNTVDVIVAFHLIEHLSRKDAFNALLHWRNLLKEKGKLILEWPDLRRICSLLVNQDNDEYWIPHLYGLDRFPNDGHLWGYTRATMKDTLTKAGYHNILITGGTDYHIKECPCLRVEANK